MLNWKTNLGKHFNCNIIIFVHSIVYRFNDEWEKKNFIEKKLDKKTTKLNRKQKIYLKVEHVYIFFFKVKNLNA